MPGAGLWAFYAAKLGQAQNDLINPPLRYSPGVAATAPAELRPTLGGRIACPAAGSGLASQVRQTPFSGKDALQHS